MMLRNKFILLLCCASFLNLNAQFKEYKYASKIQKPSSSWHKIKLEESVLDKVKSDYSDLRIFQITAEDTIESPYILETLHSKIEAKVGSFKITNSSKKGDSFYYTLSRTTSEEISEIMLNFSRSNFDWHVTLEGSNSQNEWFELLKNYRIVSISNEETSFSYTKLAFSPATYRNFRLKITDLSPPDLSSASYSNSYEQINFYDLVKYKTSEIIQDKENKRTLVKISLGKKTPLSSIKINVESKFDFYRPIKIFASMDSLDLDDEESYNYDLVTTDVINSFDDKSFEFNQISARYLTIIIENDDNQALKIGKIESFKHPIVLTGRFEQSGDYFLCYGNENASYPNYDIAYFKDRIPTNLSELTYEIIPLVQENEPVKTASKPISQLWLWGIIGAVVLLLLVFTLKMINSKSSEP